MCLNFNSHWEKKKNGGGKTWSGRHGPVCFLVYSSWLPELVRRFCFIFVFLKKIFLSYILFEILILCLVYKSSVDLSQKCCNRFLIKGRYWKTGPRVMHRAALSFNKYFILTVGSQVTPLGLIKHSPLSVFKVDYGKMFSPRDWYILDLAACQFLTEQIQYGSLIIQ